MILTTASEKSVQCLSEYNLSTRHRNVHIVKMLKHCLQLVYDNDSCVKAEKTLKAQGINRLLDASAKIQRL